MKCVPIHSKLLQLTNSPYVTSFILELWLLCNNGHDFLKCPILLQRKQPRPWTVGIHLTELEEDCWLDAELKLVLSPAAGLGFNWALDRQFFLKSSISCPLAAAAFNFPPARISTLYSPYHLNWPPACPLFLCHYPTIFWTVNYSNGLLSTYKKTLTFL